MKAVLFLGGGRITSALCAGLRFGGYRGPLVVFDRNGEKLKTLKRESQVDAAHDLSSALRSALITVVAVRPLSVPAMVQDVRACGVGSGLWVSLAAGIPLRNLRGLLPGVRWVRAMPSPVSRVGRGLTAVCFDRTVPEVDRTRVVSLLERVGQVVEVRERGFDAFTVTYSSSHGYHALAALADAAQKAGLDRKTSLIAASHALADGILYWRESGLSLDELLHEAATPGGIAAATMKAADRAGYERAVSKGLAAGMARARGNARG